jgi:hypothetical protein
MRTPTNNLSRSCILVIALLVFCFKTTAESRDTLSCKHSIQINALEFIGNFYSAVYSYEFSPHNHVMLGVAYENPRYDFGTTHAPALIIGYRRYFWKGWNADIALWPAYNSFYEKNEKKHYKGLELWSEFRTGYDFTFKAGKLHCFIMPQFIVGKGVFRGNKPQSFIDYYKHDEHVFIAPNIALGIKF